MQIAGVIYDEERKKRQNRYQESVIRATFLSDDERKHWGLLGYVLTTEQLQEAERIIINEDLRRLGTRKQLEKIKSNNEARHGR